MIEEKGDAELFKEGAKDEWIGLEEVFKDACSRREKGRDRSF